MQDLGINSSSKKNKLDKNSAAFILQGFIDYLKNNLLSHENQPIDLILMATNIIQAIKFNHTHLLGIQYLSIPEVNLILNESLAFVDLNRQENKS